MQKRFIVPVAVHCQYRELASSSKLHKTREEDDTHEEDEYPSKLLRGPLTSRRSLQVLREQPDVEQRLHRSFVRRFAARSRREPRFPLHPKVAAKHDLLSAAVPLPRKLSGDPRVAECRDPLGRRHGGPVQRSFDASDKGGLAESRTWNLQTSGRVEDRLSQGVAGEMQAVDEGPLLCGGNLL